MQSEKIIELAIKSGCKVDEYENHVCVSSTAEASFKVVFPKSTYLHDSLVEIIKKMLGL